MALHRISGRTSLGVALAVTTTLAWGTLPVALSVMLQQLDALTLTAFRFAVASLVLAGVLARRGSLPDLGGFERRSWLLLGIAIVGLALNYVGYVEGLALTTPANVQIVSQVSPFLLGLGGIFIFGERFSKVQAVGFGLLLLGLAAFFSEQISGFSEGSEQYLAGCGVILGACVAWSAYGLAQKQLLLDLSSQGLMLCIYLGCAVCLLPFASPRALLSLSPGAVGLLLYCALNTVVAYGAFAASLEHIEATRVGAIIALTPVAALGFIAATHWAWPGLVHAEYTSPLALIGAGAVVVGSALAARG